MKQCVKCGTEVQDQVKECPACEEDWTLVHLWEGPKPYCPSCKKNAEDIPGLKEEMNEVFGGDKVHVDSLIATEEGTFNPKNGHFLCMKCYIKAGMPSSPNGWTCP